MVLILVYSIVKPFWLILCKILSLFGYIDTNHDFESTALHDDRENWIRCEWHARYCQWRGYNCMIVDGNQQTISNDVTVTLFDCIFNRFQHLIKHVFLLTEFIQFELLQLYWGSIFHSYWQHLPLIWESEELSKQPRRNKEINVSPEFTYIFQIYSPTLHVPLL